MMLRLLQMTVTWTSGYNIDEAVPFVEWGQTGLSPKQSPAGTLTFTRGSMCGPPARTVGWRDPGFIHTSFLKELWPNTMYVFIFRILYMDIFNPFTWKRVTFYL
ncbi:putative phosphodiesterase I [Helianthus annuus]|nr:putative phosphodiesterase I [Helianthus annuus]